MKLYNNEKAIISLTSWTARIKTVGITIYSIIKNCPNFHIVLVLSETEFPNKELDLPIDLQTIINNDLIEIIWVNKNYKAFKKILFTMDKYKTVPIISADDDCIYTYNYAEELYSNWKNNKSCFVSYWGKQYKNVYHLAGYATLHIPNAYPNALKYLTDDIINLMQDDNFYTALRVKYNLTNAIILNKKLSDVTLTHDETEPLHNIYKKIKNNQNTTEHMEEIINELDM